MQCLTRARLSQRMFYSIQQKQHTITRILRNLCLLIVGIFLLFVQWWHFWNKGILKVTNYHHKIFRCKAKCFGNPRCLAVTYDNKSKITVKYLFSDTIPAYESIELAWSSFTERVLSQANSINKGWLAAVTVNHSTSVGCLLLPQRPKEQTPN